MKFIKSGLNVINCIIESQFGKVVIMAWPIITGAYYLSLDVMNDKFDWITKHPVFHKFIFSSLILTGVAGALIIGLRNIFYSDNRDALEEMIGCFGSAVSIKCDRFRRKIPDLSPGANVFKIITQPIEQIEQSTKFYCKMIEKVFGIQNGDVDINIIHLDDQNPHFEFQAKKNTKHTSPDKLVLNNSLAKICIESGVEHFVADKEIAAKENKYYLSQTDLRALPGSAYCYPVIIGTPINYKFAITITSYNKRLCEENDTQGKSAAKFVLSEIVKRIELELILLTMKEYCEKIKNETRKKVKNAA